MKPRLVAWVLQLAILLSASTVLLVACHGRTNPLDPGSTTWTGDGVYQDPRDPIQVLPDIVRFESYAEHGPDNWLPLEITDGFVDPRFPTSRELRVAVTFAEGITRQQAEKLYIVGRRSDTVTGLGTAVLRPWEIGYNDSLPRIVFVTLELSMWVLPEAGSFRLRVVDPSGIVLGERAWHVLPGDYTGDGVVSVGTDDTEGPDAFDGFPVGLGDTALIRSDTDADGFVEGLGRDDDMIVGMNVPQGIIPLPPEF
jgi:hypothetical protein